MDDRETGACCANCKSEIERGRSLLDELIAKQHTQQRSPLARPTRKRFGKVLAVDGKKGDCISVSFDAERLCRIERIYAEDDAGCEGTRFVHINHAGNEWPPGWGAMKQWTYEAQALGCGMNFGVLKPGQKFEMKIEFLVDCSWKAQILGVEAQA